MMNLSSDFMQRSLGPDDGISFESLKWSKVNDCHKEGYTERVHSFVSSIPSAASCLPCADSCHCENALCKQALEQEYGNLLECMKKADASLPRFKPGTEKDWWTEELSHLKQQSMDIHTLWISVSTTAM